MRRILTALALAITLLIWQSASAQKLISPSDQGGDPQEPAPYQRGFRDIRPSGPPIVLGVSGGTLLQLPSHARTVYVANEEVADVLVEKRRPDIVYLTAKKPGATVLYAADDAGNILLNKVIQVQHEPVTVIKGGTAGTGGQPAPGPMILTIPLQAVAPAR